MIKDIIESSLVVKKNGFGQENENLPSWNRDR
jgi:hypothetical protein